MTSMGKKKRALLSRLTVSQEMRELSLAYKQDVKRYHGDIPVHVLFEHRAARLEGIPG